MTTLEQCPFCGSEEIARKSEQAEVTVPYGPVVSYEAPFYACGRCHEEAPADEEEREAALQEANVKSVRSMLDDLKKDGISTAHFERALRLSQRTAARWKLGQFSAPAIALLRCVRTFPWLLVIADDDFRVPREMEPRSMSSAATIYRSLSGPALTSTETPRQSRVSLTLVPSSP
jgi:hypothetical protein